MDVSFRVVRGLRFRHLYCAIKTPTFGGIFIICRYQMVHDGTEGVLQ